MPVALSNLLTCDEWMQITWDVDTAFDIEDDSIFPMLAAGGTGVADVVLDPSVTPDRMLKMIPIQLHWHETSEHAWDGMLVRFSIARADLTDWS